MPPLDRHDRRRVHSVLRGQDVAHADRIADALKDEGWLGANRSLVIRSAVVFLVDSVQGKSSAEIFRYFTDRVARGAAQKIGAPGAPGVLSGAKA